jgi:hypothetical protein
MQKFDVPFESPLVNHFFWLIRGFAGIFLLKASIFMGFAQFFIPQLELSTQDAAPELLQFLQQSSVLPILQEWMIFW